MEEESVKKNMTGSTYSSKTKKDTRTKEGGREKMSEPCQIQLLKGKIYTRKCLDPKPSRNFLYPKLILKNRTHNKRKTFEKIEQINGPRASHPLGSYEDVKMERSEDKQRRGGSEGS